MSKLFINDMFWTFQGEGFNAGRRSLFVRMPKCNLACSWCDTTFDTFEKIPFDEFSAFALQEKAKFAVVTGGEPLLNKHTPIVVKLLKELDFYVACETNGTQPYVEGIDWVTCSPKRDANYEIHPGLKDHISELKIVVDKGFDFEVLKGFESLLCKKYLSPEFTNMKENLARIEEFIKENPHWRISLQTHKWMEIK